jgi:hypothetical protein
MKRSALVIELLCMNPIGQGVTGEATVFQYLQGLSEAIGAHAASEPTAHLSDKYGLAAWLPLKGGGAIHLYVWDDRSPSFISIDILGFGALDEPRAISFTRDFFHVSNDHELVYRRTYTSSSNWRNLAPEVHRQRLLLISPQCQAPSAAIVEQYLPKLSTTLDMRLLSTKLVNQYTAWSHWETSGCVYHWQQNSLFVDIYACKAFQPQRAIDFTQDFLNLSQINAIEY